MNRDLSLLASDKFDLLVVGGGIYGACVARDAAMRGLKVALIERGDFGAATSHNSLKLIHGGLRYLQHLDFRRVRQSVIERRIWSTIAPHRIRPLKFVMPTYGHGTRGPEAIRAAMMLHELVGFDRNRGLAAHDAIPRGRIIRRAEVEQLVPGVKTKGLTGAAIWYDGQMLDADRIVLECLQSAGQHDAVFANHVEAEKLTGDTARIRGVEARDVLCDDRFEIRASVVVNACGPWIGGLLGSGPLARSWRGEPGWTKGMNLVTRKLSIPHAIGMASDIISDATVGSTRRLFFMTPWLDCTVIGTSHLPYAGDPREYRFEEADLIDFLEEINKCFSTTLTRKDIHYCYAGLTPADEESGRGRVARVRQSRVVDHYSESRVNGLVTVVGVKYTTARRVSEEAVDLVFRKLDKVVPPCSTGTTLLPGACDFEARPPNQDGQECFQAQCLYSVEHEMAMTLCDGLLRRTNRAARGVLRHGDVAWCADMMARKLAWDQTRQRRELDGLRDVLARHGQHLDCTERSYT